MLFVLVFFLITTVLYITANIFAGVKNDSLDKSEMELIEEQQGKEKKKLYQGMQYASLGIAFILLVITSVFVFKPSRLLFKIIIFVSTLTCAILFASAGVQYNLVIKVDILQGGSIQPNLNKFKNLYADSPRFNIDFAIGLLFYIPVLYLAYNIHYNEDINFFKNNKVKKSKKKAKNDIDEIIKKEAFD